MNVTDAMVHAYSKAYDKNWDEQSRAPEDAPELGTFFAMRAGLQAALAARQPVGEPDAFLVQAVKDGETWEHRWYVPRWGDPDPSALEGAVYEIRGRKHPELGIYRVKPFYAAPAQAVDLDELRRAVCVVNVVGQIDGHDVVRRNSVLYVIDTRRQRLIDSQAVGNG